MMHLLYGDLGQLWRKTHGDCHLCHDEVGLHTYGLIEILGAEAATIDHLEPQSHGGDHDHDNLSPAHLGCKASRGTDNVALARYRMAGTFEAPLSTAERVGLGAAATGLGALLGGSLAARPDEHGRNLLNSIGAWIGGGIGLLLACVALS